MNEEPYVPLIARPRAPIPRELVGTQPGDPENYMLRGHETVDTRTEES